MVCCEETVPKSSVLRFNLRYVTETVQPLTLCRIVRLCGKCNAWNVHSEQAIMALMRGTYIVSRLLWL